MPKQMRRMFAYILVFCQVEDAHRLWNEFKRFMIEDFTRQGIEERDAEVRAFQKIQCILIVNGRRLSHFGLEDPPEYRPNVIQDEIDEARERQREAMIEQLNADQRDVFDIVMRAVENDDKNRRYFFVSGAAGTGKTFLYNTLIRVLNGRRENVIAVAWTGIAASLLKNGRTVHSRFRLPVPITENSTSLLKAQSDEATVIRDAKLIIWDEVTMTTRTAFELVDRTLKDLCRNDRLFGGKCVILEGDFKQCLPVVQNGDRTAIVANCIKSSIL
ncbi:ATP-dependent DNA helicase pif1-like [Tribolium madens]|uniref:ATP-dependent DNA helicase pif1-like n=1 Tax=Tribolium madens TaxID=41895 RepID=UPI001CF7566E|nr:ATP-dependent DNA helicase pif1-like [Tribolium madens]